MSTIRKNVALLMVAFLGAASILANSPETPETPTGISYTNVVVAKVPWSIQVVRIERDRGRYEIVCNHAGGGALGLGTLSAQVAAAGTGRGMPVAAINGGFYLRDNGKTNPYAGFPRGLQIVDGEVLSGPAGDATVWFDYAGQPDSATVTSQFTITWPDGRQTPFTLNGPRADGMIELYTPAARPSTRTVGGRELVLEPPVGGGWPPLRMERDYSARVRQIHPAGNTPLSDDTLVLSLGPAIMSQFQGITTGAVVRISTRSLPALHNVKTAISGGPLLLWNGQRQKIHASPSDAYQFSSMLERHPRTALGWNENCLFLVQVDGRQKDLSLGMTLGELSSYLLKLGCTAAINLDGGGSSSLWYEGSVRSSPCDGFERGIANSLIVLRKK